MMQARVGLSSPIEFKALTTPQQDQQAWVQVASRAGASLAGLGTVAIGAAAYKERKPMWNAQAVADAVDRSTAASERSAAAVERNASMREEAAAAREEAARANVAIIVAGAETQAQARVSMIEAQARVSAAEARVSAAEARVAAVEAAAKTAALWWWRR